MNGAQVYVFYHASKFKRFSGFFPTQLDGKIQEWLYLSWECSPQVIFSKPYLDGIPFFVNLNPISQQTYIINDMKLLATKLQPPALSKHILKRLRLLSRLDDVRDYKICLLSAPTGYGKTSLVREWINQTDLLVSWITLDERDNEVNRFISYITEAMVGVLPEKDEHLITPLPFQGIAPIEAYLTSLINQITASRGAFALVLNDYEVITSTQCHDVLTFLIEYAPENLSIIVLSRLDPPLPLMKWRARDQLLEIRTEDLRFSHDEISDFLIDIMKCNLTNGEIQMIDQKTEGWAASLHLLSLSIQSPTNKSRFFQALDDSLNYIIDFLTDEVLVQLPYETQTFLYQISILSRFNGDLCHAVTKNPHSESILRDLEHHNLFISHFDEDHQWYHFHPLFAACLEQHLQDDQLIDAAELHRRSADWYASNGHADEALDHAFKAHDIDRAVQIMESYAILWIDQADYQTFKRWFNLIPREKLFLYPRLSAYFLCGLIDGRNLNEFNSYIDIQRKLQDHPKVGAMIKAAQARAYFIQGDYQRALDILEKNLAVFRANPPQSLENLFAYSFTWIVQIGIYLHMERLQEADNAWLSAIPTYLQTGLTGFATVGIGGRARIQMKMGHLHQAEEILEQGLLLLRRWSGESGVGLRYFPACTRIYGPLSRLYYEQNRLTNAIEMAQKVIESTRSSNYVWGWGVVEAYATIGLAYWGLSEKASAFNALDKLQQYEKILASYPISHMYTRRIAIRRKIQLALMLAQEDAALYSQIEEWIDKMRGEGLDESEGVSAVWAYCLIKQGKIEKATPILQDIIKKAEIQGRNGDLIEYLLFLPSEESVNRAVELAKPQGYCRTFVDSGERVWNLLAKNGSAYTKKILDAIHPPSPAQAPQNKTVWFNGSERQIIKLLSKECTNQQIAYNLHLSVNTVKWYTHQIYIKLGVKNRREAMASARKLNLI